MRALPEKTVELAGWGNVASLTCRSFRPETSPALTDVLTRAPGTLIARGQGRAYGDAALNAHGVLLTRRLDRFLAFDAQSGLLTAQAGVSLHEVLEIFIPRGWLPPVLPGTRHVSLGGALACNIHGKNHYRTGEFSRHVEAFTLRLASGARVECTRQATPELFWATAGGMGLTGVIETVTLRLIPITTASLRTQTWRVASAQEMAEAMRTGQDAEYMIGWIDHFSGRGAVEKAWHMRAEEGGAPLAAARAKTPRRVPCFAPSLLLNRYSMELYNRRRFARFGAQWREETVDFSTFFHPLDGIAQWNRLYGRRGFHQYQLLLPDGPDTPQALAELLAFIRARGVFSFLAVMKYHGAGEGALAFSAPGFSLALDFPNSAKVRAVLPELNARVLAHGGRVYLAKDAVLDANTFERMYGGPELEQWRSIVQQADPGGRFNSAMNLRLGLRGGGV